MAPNIGSLRNRGRVKRSTKITIVRFWGDGVGAVAAVAVSVGAAVCSPRYSAKLVICCRLPSSKISKSAFFSPCTRCPCESVTKTSTLTIETSIDSPMGGICCATSWKARQNVQNDVMRTLAFDDSDGDATRHPLPAPGYPQMLAFFAQMEF